MSSTDRPPEPDAATRTTEDDHTSTRPGSSGDNWSVRGVTVGSQPNHTRDTHLHQIDFFRLVTFAGVIFDHVMLELTPITNVAAGSVELFLHYTRNGFFALTGFVLTYQYRHRDLKPVAFWRRRYKLIGLPFLVWTLFYWLFLKWQHGGVSEIVDNVSSGAAIALAGKSLGYDIVTGTAFYHLYFLSVSMQIYAIYPLLLWVMRKTWGYHRYLLTISFSFHCLLLVGMVRAPLDIFTHGVLGLVWRHMWITLLPYQFYVVLGALAAMHFEAFQRIILRLRWYVLPLGAAVVAVTLWYYLHSTDQGEAVARASGVFMIHNTWAYLSIIAMLYCVGTFWLQRRRAGSAADSFIKTAADRSFAVYLAHALVLRVLETTVVNRWDVNPAITIGIIFAATIVLTVVIVETLRRSPISLITTGRSAISWREQNPIALAASSVALLAVGFALRATTEATLGTLLAGVGIILAVTATHVFAKRHSATTARV